MRRTDRRTPAPEVERLALAFEAFTSATSTLESAYGVLQDQVIAQIQTIHLAHFVRVMMMNVLFNIVMEQDPVFFSLQPQCVT